MEDKYKKLLGSINLVEPPKGLEQGVLTYVLTRVSTSQKRSLRIKAFAFGSSTLASFGLSLWAIIYLIESIKVSGFSQYLSLIFSENGAALAYWRELSLSLAESLPIFGLIIFFASIGFFIWSLGKISPPAPSYFKRGFPKVSS